MALFRNMEERDLEQVVQIENEVFSTPWKADDFQDGMKEANNGYFVIEEDGLILGYCGYWGIVGEGNIYNVAIRPEYRGKNLGFKMLSDMLAVGYGRGISDYTLEVRSSNQAAIRLYEKLGFERAGIRKDFYTSPTEDAVIMWLKLIQ